MLWYIVSSIASWYRLRHIPGPFLASFSYLWVAKEVMRGRGGEYEMLRKYGSLVRTSPNYIVTDDPNVVRQINGARSTANRDPWYIGTKFDPEHDSMISMPDYKIHDKYKARAAHAYNGRDHIDMEGAVDKQLLHFIDIIRRDYLSGSEKVQQFDFAHRIRYFNLDVITSVGFGNPFGFMDAKGDLWGYSKSIDAVMGFIATAGDVPALRRLFISPIMAPLFAPKETDRTGLGKVIGVARDIVRSRFEKKSIDGKDMIGAFMRQGLTQTEVETENILQIIAGSETTATAIRSTMLHIMSTPRVNQRLKAEIKEAIDSGAASYPIKNEEAKKLPYLQAVIYEGLRMRPPGVYGFYKKIPAGGETINGHFIPGGTAVGWNAPAMMRVESIFGQDAQVFRPERFLTSDEEKKNEIIRTVDLVFGYGRWMCAGKTLALIELNKAYFELLRAFEWQLLYAGKPWTEVAYTGWVQKHMWVRVTEAGSEDQ